MTKEDFIEVLDKYDSDFNLETGETIQAIYFYDFGKLADELVKLFAIPAVSGCDSIKTNWDLRECFKQLRVDKNHHLGLGDIRLTMAQQEDICDLVERFYHCR